jgi:hypothetical protein
VCIAAASDKALSAPLELLQGSRPLRALAAICNFLPFKATTLAHPSHLDVTTVTVFSRVRNFPDYRHAVFVMMTKKKADEEKSYRLAQTINLRG